MSIPSTGTPFGLEIPVKDTARASTFYSAVFNWTFLQKSNIGAPPERLQVFKVPGDTFPGGGIIRKVDDAEMATGSGTTKVYFLVDDIEDVLKRVVENGGQRIGEKQAEGEKGFYQFFGDSEGNTHALYAFPEVI